MAATIAFAISAAAALVIAYLCYRGLLNTYFLGGPRRIHVGLQGQLWYVVISGFIAGCLLSLL